MTPAMESHDASRKNQYRTSAGYQMDERRLLLRGGPYDGKTWVGVVAVGKRVFCGEGAWSTEGVYLVSDRVEIDETGQQANIATPAFATTKQ